MGKFGRHPLVRKVTAHTTPEAEMAGVVTAHDLACISFQAGGFGTPYPPNVRAASLSANLAVTRMAHWIARVGSARQRLDFDSTWIPARGRATTEGASERDLGPCRCQRSRPSSEEGARWSRAPQGAYARSASTQSARHVLGAQAPQAPERAVQRHNSGMTALRATELLISCREARWFQCSLCGSYGGVSSDGRCSATANGHRRTRRSHHPKRSHQQQLEECRRASAHQDDVAPQRQAPRAWPPGRAEAAASAASPESACALLRR